MPYQSPWPPPFSFWKIILCPNTFSRSVFHVCHLMIKILCCASHCHSLSCLIRSSYIFIKRMLFRREFPYPSRCLGSQGPSTCILLCSMLFNRYCSQYLYSFVLIWHQLQSRNKEMLTGGRLSDDGTSEFLNVLFRETYELLLTPGGFITLLDRLSGNSFIICITSYSYYYCNYLDSFIYFWIGFYSCYCRWWRRFHSYTTQIK